MKKTNILLTLGFILVTISMLNLSCDSLFEEPEPEYYESEYDDNGNNSGDNSWASNKWKRSNQETYIDLTGYKPEFCNPTFFRIGQV